MKKAYPPDYSILTIRDYDWDNKILPQAKEGEDPFHSKYSKDNLY